MRNLIEVIGAMREFVKSERDSELYMHLSVVDVFDWENSSLRRDRKCLGGLGKIIYDGKGTLGWANLGKLDITGIDELNNRKRETIPSKNPLIDRASDEELDNYFSMISDIFSYSDKKELSEGQLLKSYKNRLDLSKRFIVQHEVRTYFSCSSFGGIGYSLKNTTAFYGAESASGTNNQIGKYNLIISPFTNSLSGDRGGDLNSLCDVGSSRSPKSILLSQLAFGKLLYLFLEALLCDVNRCNVQADIDWKSLNLSRKLSIEENSPKNETITGTIDEEGVKREPSDLVKSGKVVNVINNIGSPQFPRKTGSAYRKDFASMAAIRPSKIYVKPTGNKTPINISEESIYISDWLNLEQGISWRSLNFSAMGMTPIGICQISSNLLDVLKNIKQVFSDVEYVIDGSIRTGSTELEIDDSIKLRFIRFF